MFAVSIGLLVAVCWGMPLAFADYAPRSITWGDWADPLWSRPDSEITTVLRPWRWR